MTTKYKTQMQIESIIEEICFAQPEQVSYCSWPSDEEHEYNCALKFENCENIKAALWRRLNTKFSLLEVFNTVEQAELRDSVILQSWDTKKIIDGLIEGINPFEQFYNHPTGIKSDFTWMEMGK